MEMPVELETARKRRERERARATRESVIEKDCRNEDKREDGKGREEGGEEDGDDPIDLKGGQVDNDLEVLLINDEYGLSKLPLGSRVADKDEDEEDDVGDGG